MKNVFKIGLFLLFLLAAPSSSKACDVRLYAKSYINQINAVVAGKKPNLVVEKGSDPNRYAFYENGTIHIYNGDYQGACSDETPFLKSVIAHEYAHYIEKKLAPVAKVRGERLAFIAEHAIGDELLGNAIYDNELNKEDAVIYVGMKSMLKNRKMKNIPMLMPQVRI